MDRTKSGWLRPYLLALDDMFSKRWNYWLRTLDEGKVLEERIPQIEWLGQGEKETRKNLQDCLDYVHHQRRDDTFSQFTDWLLYGFGDSAQREFPKKVDDNVNAHWYKTFNMGLMLKHPYDYLGEIAAELYGKGKWNSTGYFPTPLDVCVMMAKMTMNGAREEMKTASVCDPCVGSGRMLMVASNSSLNLYGMDIDYNVLKVCKVNMWMYVPWAIHRPKIEGLESAVGIGGGDSLAPSYTEPIQKVTPEVQQQLLSQRGEKQTDLFGS